MCWFILGSLFLTFPLFSVHTFLSSVSFTHPATFFLPPLSRRVSASSLCLHFYFFPLRLLPVLAGPRGMSHSQRINVKESAHKEHVHSSQEDRQSARLWLSYVPLTCNTVDVIKAHSSSCRCSSASRLSTLWSGFFCFFFETPLCFFWLPFLSGRVEMQSSNLWSYGNSPPPMQQFPCALIQYFPARPHISQGLDFGPH